jgi:hypothetical protein
VVRLKISVLSLLLIHSVSFACEWPQMHRADTFFDRMLSPIRNWFSSNAPGATVLYGENYRSLEFPWRTIEFFGGNNTLSTKVNGILRDTFILQYSSGKNLSFEELMQFRWPPPQKGHRLQIYHLQTNTHVLYDLSDTDTDVLIVERRNSGMQAKLFETNDQTGISSKLWYRCNVCNGDPLIMLSYFPSCQVQYFTDHSNREVSPGEFAQKSNMYGGGFLSVYSDLVDRQRWPYAAK